MNALQHTVSLDAAMAGQRLAGAVLDDRGQVLVNAGSELTLSMVQALLRRGVKQVCVARGDIALRPAQADPQAAANEEAQNVDPQTRRERASARVAHLFRHATQRGQLNPLMHSVLQYRLEGLP